MLYKRTLQPINQNKNTQAPTASFFTPETDNDVQSRAIDILARTIWGEARGESLRGMEAVASVILNRVATADKFGGKYWWGNTVETVCRKKGQFSCWDETDPNYPKLLAVGKGEKEFEICQRIARRAVAGTLEDVAYGATHYHTRDIAPYWARGHTPVITIGNHVFYRIEV